MNTMISGHFCPVHDGHVDYFKQAVELGDVLICVVSSDAQLMQKKGRVNIPEEGRKDIVSLILQGLTRHSVTVVNTWDGDASIAKALEVWRPSVLFRGFDKKLETMPANELEVCRKLGIEIRHAQYRGIERHSSAMAL